MSKPKWIWLEKSRRNEWVAFKNVLVLDEKPETTEVIIACDSKYWLWINEELVVWEGQLKRGPNRRDSYCDKVDLTKHLKIGKNIISVLVWYFGKHGFHHLDSGHGGLYIESLNKLVDINTDKRWKVKKCNAYLEDQEPYPNYRLSESNVIFDARRNDMEAWTKNEFDFQTWDSAHEYGFSPNKIWGELQERMIPLWKISELRDYENNKELNLPFITQEDTLLVCKLPSNIQIAPYLKVESEENKKIVFYTDTYITNEEGDSVRCEYITKAGVQSHQFYAWFNGHYVNIQVPKGVKVLELKYRETGYDCKLLNNIETNIEIVNKYFKKAQRTMYVSMRDCLFDPDRERAQWWGDIVVEIVQLFALLDRNADKIIEKGIKELIDWQHHDGVLVAPIPIGGREYEQEFELPQQMLATISTYGIWKYFMYTGDKAIIEYSYQGAKRYLELFNLQENGLVEHRVGSWDWADWGENIDLEVLDNVWYYLALKAVYQMAEVVGSYQDFAYFQTRIKSIESNFNQVFWNGKEYRGPTYLDIVDDRAQALAVVSGLAEKGYYPFIKDILLKSKNASPYLEKYVIEALYYMGYSGLALMRFSERYQDMINDETCDTLYEVWEKGWGGFNHAWSGGVVAVFVENALGLQPAKPGWEEISFSPQLAEFDYFNFTMVTVKGDIKVQYRKNNASLEYLIENQTKSPIKFILNNPGIKDIFINKERNKISASYLLPDTEKIEIKIFF